MTDAHPQPADVPHDDELAPTSPKPPADRPAQTPSGPATGGQGSAGAGGLDGFGTGD